MDWKWTQARFWMKGFSSNKGLRRGFEWQFLEVFSQHLRSHNLPSSHFTLPSSNAIQAHTCLPLTLSPSLFLFFSVDWSQFQAGSRGMKILRIPWVFPFWHIEIWSELLEICHMKCLRESITVSAADNFIVHHSIPLVWSVLHPSYNQSQFDHWSNLTHTTACVLLSITHCSPWLWWLWWVSRQTKITGSNEPCKL